MAQAARGEQTRRLISVDLLRGLAALAVLLYHAQGFFRRNAVATIWGGGIYDLWVEPGQQVVAYLLFGFGFLGVPLFFVISGFCIHLPFADRSRPLKPGPFARRRFIRLYPAYLATCLVGFAFAIAKQGLGEAHATLSNLVGHLFFWHYDYPIAPHGVEFTIVIWSIVIEVHFYAMYALIFGALLRVGIGRAAAIGLVVGLIYRGVWAAGGLGDAGMVALLEPHRFALARFGEWLLGAWIAQEYATGRLRELARSRWFGWNGVWLGLGLVLSSVLGIALLHGRQYSAELPTTIGFAWLLASLLTLELSDRFNLRGRFRRVALWLGDRSYSLYLVHYLAIGFAGEVFARLMNVPDKDALAGTPVWFGVTLGAICLALVAADLMYRLIERPSHQLARRTGRF